MDIFSRLRLYSPSPRLDPLENYLTEAFAAILEIDRIAGHQLLNDIAAQCGVPSVGYDVSISYLTQFPLPPGYADLIVKIGNDALFIFEHKTKSPVVAGQLKAYRERAKEKWKLPIFTVLITPRLEGISSNEADCITTWTSIANQLNLSVVRSDESSFLVEQFIRFLSRQGLSKPEGIFPAYFRIHAEQAKTSQAGYEPAGYHLAVHARDLVGGDTDADGFDIAIEELDAAIESDDSEELLWRWFKKYMPRCMNEVSRHGKTTFLKGVMQAVEAERL